MMDAKQVEQNFLELAREGELQEALEKELDQSDLSKEIKQSIRMKWIDIYSGKEKEKIRRSEFPTYVVFGVVLIVLGFIMFIALGLNMDPTKGYLLNIKFTAITLGMVAMGINFLRYTSKDDASSPSPFEKPESKTRISEKRKNRFKR